MVEGESISIFGSPIIMTNSDLYFPPFRFAAVEENVFRGALPKERNLSFMSTLNLTTIISCIPEPYDHLTEFANRNNISLVLFKTEKPKEHIPLSFPKVLQILQLLCDSTQIIYLHCLDGVLVTSMIIMGLRKLQGWYLDAYMNEACRFLRDGNFTFLNIGMLSVEESEFIEKLSGEFEVPLAIPKWLWNGTPVLKHSFFKIKSCASSKLNKLLPASSQFDSPIAIESESVRMSLTQLEIEKEDLRRYVSKVELKQVYADEEQDDEQEESTVSRTLEALDLEVSNL